MDDKFKDKERQFLERNIIFLNDEINDESSSSVITNMLYMASRNEDPITFYVKSEGGNADDCFAIINTMNFIKNEVRTIAIGDCCSSGAYILAAGTKGKRFALPFSRIMIHQVNGGVEGEVSHIKVTYENIAQMNEMLLKDFARNTGQKLTTVRQATAFDNYMSAQEACDFGIVDKVVRNQHEIK